MPQEDKPADRIATSSEARFERSPATSAALLCTPLTHERWADLEKLFGAKGACGGCWCMCWRLPRKQFDAQKGAANRLAFHALVEAGPPPGVLAYCGAEPVGWCAVAPRESYVTLSRSRTLKPVDSRPVWSVTCLFIHRTMRRKGVSVELLKAAADFVKASGGVVVEGYPVQSSKGNSMPDVFAWTGTVAAFRKAGFLEVARPSATRIIMRRELA